MRTTRLILVLLSAALVATLVAAPPGPPPSKQSGVSVTLQKSDGTKIAGEAVSWDVTGIDLQSAGKADNVEWKDLAGIEALSVFNQLLTVKGTGKDWLKAGNVLASLPDGKALAEVAYAKAMKLDRTLEIEINDARDALLPPPDPTRGKGGVTTAFAPECSNIVNLRQIGPDHFEFQCKSQVFAVPEFMQRAYAAKAMPEPRAARGRAYFCLRLDQTESKPITLDVRAWDAKADRALHNTYDDPNTPPAFEVKDGKDRWHELQPSGLVDRSGAEATQGFDLRIRIVLTPDRSPVWVTSAQALAYGSEGGDDSFASGWSTEGSLQVRLLIPQSSPRLVAAGSTQIPEFEIKAVNTTKNKQGVPKGMNVKYMTKWKRQNTTTGNYDEDVNPPGEVTQYDIITELCVDTEATLTTGGFRASIDAVAMDANGNYEGASGSAFVIFNTRAVIFPTDPIRTGFTLNGSTVVPLAKQAEATAAADPGDMERYTFEIAGATSEATVDSVQLIEDGQGHNVSATFNVRGHVATPNDLPEGDATIQAKDPFGNVVGEAVVLVVRPWRIATPHPTANGVVTGFNLCANVTTSPFFYSTPANQVKRTTWHVHWLDITVNDQFGQTLDPVYNGSAVEEFMDGGWRAMNQNVTAGVYRDPTGSYSYIDPDLNPTDPDAVAWPTQPVRPIFTGTWTQNVPVRVGGHQLDVGVVNRTVTAASDGTVTITWP